MKNLTLTICLTLAVLLGSTGTSWGADFNKGVDAARSGDYATALRDWQPLAEQGDVGALFVLGWMYHDGDGVPQDYKTAVMWWRTNGRPLVYWDDGLRYRRPVSQC